MAVKLRPFQEMLEREVYSAWAAGAVDVLAVAATGSGKTVLFSDVMRREPSPSVAIAHRQELVSQISLALARNGVRHKIIGPPAVARVCAQLHREEIGYSMIDPNSRTAVAGVDTLIRMDGSEPWFQSVRLIVLDEAHHCLKGNISASSGSGEGPNKWGKARLMFPNARGLHVTATPGRLDCKGLGRHADGFIDKMILAPGMRDLINMGYLTDYRIVCAESDVDLQGVTVGASGEFVQAKLRDAVHRSKTLVGDVVKEYKARAMGKLGITFAVDIASATEIAQAFRDNGVPAMVVTSDTPDALRADILRRFRRRELLQLVNVDLFGEGFDLPAIEVVSMARHTASFILFAQMFGRMLRLMISPELSARWGDFTDAERRAHIAASPKPRGLLIDHVGNMVRHGGPPDKPRVWSLDRGEKRSSGQTADAVPYRVCVNPVCAAPYERVLSSCPYCGHSKPPPAARSAPDQVDGNFLELSDEAQAALRGEQALVDGPPVVAQWMSAPIAGATRKNHYARQQAQAKLRDAIGWWTALQDALGRTDPAEQMRRFYFSFGVDVATACTLRTADALALRARLAEALAAAGVALPEEPAAPPPPELAPQLAA